MRHDVLRIAVVGLLIASMLEAQGPRRRTVAPPQSGASVNAETFVLALPASASHVVSTVRCTLVDTRNAPGPFGGPRLSPGVTRSFVVPNGPCPGIPIALGYALTFTGITPDTSPVHLKAWATGAAIPSTPTLTLSKGTASVANNTAPAGAAIEASGSGSVDVQSDVGTDLLIELTAYYTPGLVLSVSAGPGLFGGGYGDVMLGIAPFGVGTNELAEHSVTFRKISADFSGPGTVLMSDGSSVSWQLPPQGTITGVNAGTGLSGGGNSGTVSLNVNFAGTGTLDTAARSDHKHYVQTVIVNPLPSPIDSGTSLMNALAGIMDASAAKPYLLKIEPGIYDLGTATPPLTLKPFVDVEGSGEFVTRITHVSSGATVNATVYGSGANVELRDLTVASTGGAPSSTAIYLTSDSSWLTHVTAIATGGTVSDRGIEVVGAGATPAIFREITVNSSGSPSSGVFGIMLFSGANVIVRNASLTTTETTGAPGVPNSAGIENQSSTLSGSQIDITASNVNGIAMALFNLFTGASSTIRGGSFVVSASSDAYGIENNSTLTISDVSMTTSSTAGPSVAHGVVNPSGAVPGAVIKIDHCRIQTSGVPVNVSDPGYTVRIGATRLEGDAVFGPAVCAGVYDENYTFYPGPTCP